MSTIAIFMAPIYIRYLGLESYGLIGFFTLIQSWMQIFDMGFSATLSRQSAQYCSGTLSAFEFKSVFKAIQNLFSILSVGLIIVALYVGYYYSNFWIKASHLDVLDVKKSVILILIVSILRWQGGLYRGIVNGFEHQVWLNQFNIFFSTIKYLLVLIYLHYFSQNIVEFFLYQLIVNLLEFLFLFNYVQKLMPQVNQKITSKFDLLKKNLRFSLSIAFSSSVWVFVTQLDKLILSKYLTLKDFACYSMAVTLASGINVIISPLSSAILPRFSGLIAQKKQLQFTVLYREVTKLIVILVTPIVLMMVFYGDKILLAWSNNQYVAEHSSKILLGYAIGNGVLAILAMAYYLQFAIGKLRLHLLGNVFFIVVLIPMLIYATLKWGGVGASYVWMICNTLYLFLWVPIVHQKYLNYSYFNWLKNDVISVCVISGIISFWLLKLILVSSGRFLIITQAGLASLLAIFFSGLIVFPQFRFAFINRDFSFLKRSSIYG